MQTKTGRNAPLKITSLSPIISSSPLNSPVSRLFFQKRIIPFGRGFDEFVAGFFNGILVFSRNFTGRFSNF